jgi:hypothetical protein
MKQYRTACAVFVHAVGAAAIGAYLLFLVPKSITYWGRFFEGGGGFPKVFLFVIKASVFFQHFGIFIIPIVVVMLWLDGLMHSRLLNSKHPTAATFWASGVTIFLFAALFFVAWAMSTPLR